MIRIETSKGSDVLEKEIYKLQNDFPLSKITKIIQEDIISDTKKRGWRRIANTIKTRRLDKNNQEVFLGGKQKDKDVSVFLHAGTKRHFIAPVKKLALSWVQGGTRRFSKGHFVSGIKATDFFKVSQSAINKIGLILKK